MFYELKEQTAFEYLDELERITQGRLTIDQKVERLRVNFLVGQSKAETLIKNHMERI